MRKLKHDRRRQRKLPTQRAITLTVEALEPRLVLSAVGFGFEGARGPSDLHDRNVGNRDANRPAFAQQFHDNGDHERFERAQRFEYNLPMPVRDGHPGGGRPNESSGANSGNLGGNGSRLSDRSVRPPRNFGGAEGEFTVSISDFEDSPPYEPIDVGFKQYPAAETANPKTPVVFISLTPTISPARGEDLSHFGPPATRLTPPPRPFSADSVSQQRSSAVTLPVALSVASSAASRTPPIISLINSSAIRLDSESSSSDTVAVQRASESGRIAEPGSAAFVSLATKDLASWANVDSQSFEAAFDSFNRLSDSARPISATDRTVASLKGFVEDQLARRSEDAFWADVSEGGLIEIDSEVADNSPEGFEFAGDDADEAAGSKRLLTHTQRDTFWFDFGDTRLDLICDSSDVEELAEGQTLDDADAGEEAWLLDEGGMIVLTTRQITGVEAAVDEAPEESAIGEIDIPVDAGIGVFQAIEVAAALIDHHDGGQAVDDTTAPIEGKDTVETDEAIPSSEQSAEASESGPSRPIRAAAMPLLLAMAGFLSRGQKIRRTVADRRTRV